MSTAEPILIVQTGAAPAEVRARFGDFPDWFTHALGGNGTRTVRVDTGGRLPPPDEVNAAVITGSAAMVSEHLPWSEATAGWLREAADSGAALLGVCYGHQLLAHAFGGGVDYHPDGREIGTIEVDTLPSARDDALFGKVIGRHPAQATHEQSVLELPTGAVRLAGVGDKDVADGAGLAGRADHRRADQAAADHRHPRIDHAHRSALHELGQRLDHGAVMLFQADGDAQVVGQAVTGHVAGDQASRAEEGVGLAGGLARRGRKAH